ncbi:hypothetical protein MMC07_004676 [Pseudocyphellaria aurata]|nr:hypothetical protein [Pseudocyphellaria aurata]
MPSKRKAVERLASPSKKSIPSRREKGAEHLSTVIKTLGKVMLPGHMEIAAQTAKNTEESETLLVENGQIPQLSEDSNRRMVEREEAKRRLVKEQMLWLKEEERQAAHRQEMVWLDAEASTENELTKLQVQQDRIQEELLIHAKLEIMQLARKPFRTPNETENEVCLSTMPNDREAMKPTGDRANPLYTAELGRGRFYIETAAMWDDWCERMDAVENRETVLPRSYEEVKVAKLAKLAKEKEHALAIEARNAEKRAAERERLWELAKIRQRLPSIPAHAPGQHPGYRSRKGQPKWSKRVESTPPRTKKVILKLTAPKKPVEKPVDKGKGKRQRNCKGRSKGEILL